MLCAALLRRAGNSWSKATSVVAGEQALDLAFFMVALPLAALSASESMLHLMGAVPAGVYEVIFIIVVLSAGTLWLALRELGHELSFGLLFALQAVILHAALLTGIPSGGGSADLGLAAALAPWVSAPVIATVLLQWRFATLYFPLIISALGLAAVAARA